MAPDERKEKGAAINTLKDKVSAALAQRRQVLKEAALEARLAAEKLDVTLPVRMAPADAGRIHPLSQVMDELAAIFADLGFSLAEGPDIESDDLQFHAAQFPARPSGARRCTTRSSCRPTPNGERKLLRTHTTPGPGAHDARRRSRRSAIICPGRTYRIDSDQTHTPMFHQVEGLVIDTKATSRPSEVGAGRILQGLLRSRRRQDALPPELLSLHRTVDGSRHPMPSRKGGEIRFGEGEDWLEILGCGMVHPNVLRNCDLDPEIYQGFAWGMGVDRLAMLKYGMPDLRAFFDADIRWLTHYGFRPLDLPSLLGGLSS